MPSFALVIHSVKYVRTYDSCYAYQSFCYIYHSLAVVLDPVLPTKLCMIVCVPSAIGICPAHTSLCS